VTFFCRWIGSPQLRFMADVWDTNDRQVRLIGIGFAGGWVGFALIALFLLVRR
jgi:hypothetical protein